MKTLLILLWKTRVVKWGQMLAETKR